MNSLLDKYVFLLPLPEKTYPVILSGLFGWTELFLRHLGDFDWKYVDRVMPMELTCGQFLWRSTVKLGTWQCYGDGSSSCSRGPIFHLHMGAIFTQLQVGDDCTKATEWGYSSAGQSLGRDFGAKISQQFFRSCSSGWPTKASRFCRTANVLVSWLSCRPVRRKDPSLVRL